MSEFIQRITVVLLSCLLLLGASGSAVAKNEVVFGPAVTVIDPFVVDDFNHCTNEVIQWNAVLTAFDFWHVSGNGDNQKFHIVSHFRWTAMVTGLDTGYVWETSGGGKDSIKFTPSDDFDPSDGIGPEDGVPFKEVFIENSILKPVTPGAPRIQFHALLRFKVDENGSPVVFFLDYEYTCIGK